MSGELVASVQSLVAVLQQQIDTGNDQDAVDIQEAKMTRRLPKDNVITLSLSSADLLVFTPDLLKRLEPCKNIKYAF